MVDWSHVLTEFIPNIPTLLLAAGTLLVAIRAQAQVSALRRYVNLKVDELIKATGKVAGMEGEQRGRKQERERKKG